MAEEHKPLVDSSDEDGIVSTPKKRHSWKSSVFIAVLVVVVVVALLAVGFAVGTFVEVLTTMCNRVNSIIYAESRTLLRYISLHLFVDTENFAELQ